MPEISRQYDLSKFRSKIIRRKTVHHDGHFVRLKSMTIENAFMKVQQSGSNFGLLIESLTTFFRPIQTLKLRFSDQRKGCGGLSADHVTIYN